nr:ribonuclease H-like domain-containing protein [Tanacetum cinerariifolium]
MLRDRNAKESWALLEDLALYDNESWNDPRDHVKPVKYYMEDLEQAFAKYASSRTDEAREGFVSNFMASQDARLSKFEADFKQQQTKMINKIDTVLKDITNRIVGALPSNTVKNPKLSTYPVLYACSYPTEDPQRSTHIHGSINSITIHSKQQNDSHDSMPEEEEQERKGNPEDTNIIAYIEE